MDNKKDDVHDLVNTVADDEIQQVIDPEVVIDQCNDHNNVTRNLNTKAEAIDNNPKESNRIQNATRHKKDLNDSNMDIVTFLKAEFTGLNTQDINKSIQVKLPKYTEIDLMKNNSKKHKKDPKRMYTKNRLGLFWKEPIVVQLMGSEKCSEEKEVIEYEPETGNGTVRGMLSLLLALHSITLIFTFVLYVADTSRKIVLGDGIVLWIPPFIIYVALIIFSACTKHIRTGFGVNIITAWTLILLIISLTCLCGAFRDYAIFIYTYGSMIVTDIVLIFLGFISTFNFRSGIVYVIGICTSLLADAIFSYASHTFKRGNAIFSNWTGDETFALFLTPFFTLLLIVPTIAELRLMLAGEWIELSEDDYFFGAYLMFVSLIDYPIRMLRKAGAFNSCDTAGEDE